MPSNPELFLAAERLHAHLLRRHYGGNIPGLLHGPDSGVRFNLRAWRFLKSALPFLPWRDDYAFMQTQGYWILANWMLFEATGERRYRELALETTEAILRLQTPGGFWAYPLPERKHLIATVEGNWGAIGLVASHAREPRPEFVDGARRWYEFLVHRIGFQQHQPGKAINYFDRPRGKIPNNSVEAAWVFLRLWKATRDGRYLKHVEALFEFIAAVQLPSGELPYIVESAYEKAREHYLCFQYNAFQFLKLAWCVELRKSPTAAGVLPTLARFLSTGVTRGGAAASNCAHRDGGPEADYYTAALGAALHEAARISLVETTGSSEVCYARVLSHQRPDGGFGFSRGDYGFLRDTQSYPRPQVMTLFHLLYGCDLGEGFPVFTPES